VEAHLCAVPPTLERQLGRLWLCGSGHRPQP
jgi:hypothetical protein